MTSRRRPLRRVFVSHSAEETFALAAKLAKEFRGDEVVFLIGELGAGKTVFAKGIASGLGLKDVHQVCSPTFTLMNVYGGRVPVYHFDLYRLAEEEDIRDLGFEDYIGAGVVVVEWAEKIKFRIPAIFVTIDVKEGDRRKISLDSPVASEIYSVRERKKRKRGRNEARTT